METKLKQCCEVCGSPATVYVSVVNGETPATRSYCALHAAKKGVLHPQGYKLLSEAPPPRPGMLHACSSCGMTREQFATSGEMGCAYCYVAFGAALRPMLRKLHRGTAHKGKVPRKVRVLRLLARHILDLKDRLDSAVSSERFEEAASLRDQIARMRKQAQLFV